MDDFPIERQVSTKKNLFKSTILTAMTPNELIRKLGLCPKESLLLCMFQQMSNASGIITTDCQVCHVVSILHDNHTAAGCLDCHTSTPGDAPVLSSQTGRSQDQTTGPAEAAASRASLH